MARRAKVDRQTSETTISLSLNLDGDGQTAINTGVGFFDHMLTLLGKHAAFDLEIEAKGDLHVDSHHTVEDVGICLGQALREAVGDKRGIQRYGHSLLPMDETLVFAAVDLSGRSYLVYDASTPSMRIGDFDCELLEEFWRATTANAAMNLHIVLQHGRNSHHIAEATFKATGRALKMALSDDPRTKGVPSTKGSLA